MRSVFGASEMDVEQTKQLLYPLQRVARRQEAAIHVVHHRPKSGAKYSGQTTIAGAADYMWVWESDPDTCRATLELYGTRGQRAPRLHWEYDLARKRNVWLPPDVEQAKTLVKAILARKRMTQAELVKEMANNWAGDRTPGVNALRHMLADMEGEVVARVRERKGYLYFVA